MIEICNLTKKFGTLTAVDGVSLTVYDNECFALLGFNGAGKTTLINLLTTVLSPTEGTAKINGFDLVKDREKIQGIINVSPQEIAVAKNLTVEENLSLIADMYGIFDKKQAVEETLTEFGLTEKRKVLAKKLSGGQQKRLSLALAVITKPQILFLDEPTLGLDVKARRRLWEVVQSLKSKMTIFLTTHYLEEVEALTDRIAVISNGKIKAVGTVQDLLDKTGASNLEDAFISLAEGGNE
jgi:ABC-2 type transport system ATP-binding protein